MVRIRGLGLAGAAGAVAVGALLNNKKKKKAKEKQTEAERRAEEYSSDPILTGEPVAAKPADSRACPSCGNVDTTGAVSCPICFANMDGKPNTSGFEEY